MSEKKQILIHEDKNSKNVSMFVPAVYGADVLHTNDNIAKETTSNIVDRNIVSSEKFATWGDDNQYPTNARIKAEKSGIFMQNAFTKSCMMFGQGLNYYKKIKGELVEHQDNEIDDFIANSCLDVYLLEQIQSFYLHWCAVTEHQIQQGSRTNKGNKVVALSSKEIEWCRKEITKKGVSNNLYYSAQFAENGNYDDKNGDIITLLGKESKKNFLKRLGSSKTFAQFVMFPSNGRVYYPRAPWSPLFDDDSWLDVSIETPALIRALHKNLINIKYVIHIPMDYWSFVYPKWNNYDAKKRKECIADKAKEMNNYLAGNKNQHKSFIAHYGYNESTGKEYPGFKIEPIKDYTKHDAYLPNSQAANSEILYQQGVNPSTIGLQTPGGKLGAGSGSDIRVSTNREVALLSAVERILLQPILTAHRWNEWDNDIVWKFNRSFITTLDQDKSGQKEIRNAD